MSIKILAITDIHYVSDSLFECPCKERKTNLGLEFLQRVLYRIKRQEKIDAVVLPGDFLDNAELPSASDDFDAIKKEVEKTGIPAVFIRGNHDLPGKDFFKKTKGLTNPLIIKNFIIYPFRDEYNEENICYRKKEEIEKFEQFCKKHSSKKVVTVQHNTVYPPIEASYPFNFENTDEIISCYLRNNVIASVSGHYHYGLEPISNEGILYLTLPALCESPFSYTLMTFNEKPEVEIKKLTIETPLEDYHCHTEFAYCNSGVKIKPAIERANLFGLGKITFTEHAGQLYLSVKDYWGNKFLEGIDVLKKEKKIENRMQDFKNTLLPLRSDFVNVGLEVECDKFGNLTLLEGDEKGIDCLIGAVHHLPETKRTKNEEEKEFLKFCEFLCKRGIDILAHPLRFFKKKKMKAPVHLYPVMAKMLKEYNVAAELNFHTNEPDPKFFEKCIEEGVKISLGTDAHSMYEAGDLSFHYNFLKNRLKIINLEEILYRGKK